MDTNTVFFSIILIIIICIVLLVRHASKEDKALREDTQKMANKLQMPVTLVLMANLNHRFVVGVSIILPDEIPLFTAYPMPQGVRIKPIYQASFWRELLFDLEDCMGEAKRRGDFEARKAESEFFAKEQERLNKWLFDNRPVVVSINTHGGTTRRKTSSMQRALLIAALSGIGAFVADKDGNRLTT